ncbi:MAG: sigma 54-dependent Fis family transcriptional regulator [Polyangiaceae bacterium]|jgi:transcriptional regulator with GAF, ATPase, and Fis domain|nr:sigma 54-dependent Fis family transcriptional regulator [Polyangiaceae bacterium]
MVDDDELYGDGTDTEVAPPSRSQPPGGVHRRRALLTFRDYDGEHQIELEGAAVVGSSPKVDVRINDPTLSRLHAELELRDNGLWVRDLGSRNGTYVDDVLVGLARVPEGGRLRVGSTIIAVTYAKRPSATPLWPTDSFHGMVGRSAVMRELFARLDRVAASDATVLIQGETGTGKELAAEAIHQASPRSKGPFVIVDCGALPEHLLEAELFGHAKGAFTGANAARAGAFEMAQGGTLFLDEVGELPLAMQPKLLRALESKTVRRLGETHYRPVDVRFVSATHRNVRDLVARGAFREDLYFRLAVLPVTLPPLRERREDVPLILDALLPKEQRPLVTPEVRRELASRPWLGNVRELRIFVQRLLAVGFEEAIAMQGAAPARDALPAVPLDLPFKELRDRWLNHLEREYVAGLLAQLRWNVSAVADAAGLDRSYVHRLIKKHGLDEGAGRT